MALYHRAFPWFMAALGAGAAVAVLSFPVDIEAWWAGEIDLAGDRLFDPPSPQPAAIAAIDFEAIHAELWPAAVAAEEGRQSAAFGRLREAVEADPYLTERVDRITALASADAAGNAQRLIYQVWAWNKYCDMAGVPWRLTPNVSVNGPGDAQFYVKSYQVISDTPTRVGQGYWRTRVVQRVDDLSVVEQYLGLSTDHEEGALVVAERVAAFALERVWPLLDPELDRERLALDATFAPAIRSAAANELHATDYRVLVDSAPDRFWLERTIASVNGRRSCGSTVQIGMLPFDGLHHRDLSRVQRYAATTTGPCPDFTQHEVNALVLRSHRLQAVAGLRQALEALTAWTARSIAVHEARHAADDAYDGVIPCHGCPPEITGVTRLEASAYLASFAADDVAAVSLLQACGVEQMNALGRATAIRFLTSKIGGDPCTKGPPADLPDRARALEKEIFGRVDPIQLAGDFPAFMPLERALPSTTAERPTGDKPIR